MFELTAAVWSVHLAVANGNLNRRREAKAERLEVEELTVESLGGRLKVELNGLATRRSVFACWRSLAPCARLPRRAVASAAVAPAPRHSTRRGHEKFQSTWRICSGHPIHQQPIVCESDGIGSPLAPLGNGRCLLSKREGLRESENACCYGGSRGFPPPSTDEEMGVQVGNQPEPQRRTILNVIPPSSRRPVEAIVALAVTRITCGMPSAARPVRIRLELYVHPL